MTLQDRSDNYQVQKVPCPQFELQLGNPLERRLAIHLSGTICDKENRFWQAHAVVVQRGAMLTVANHYIWDLAL